MGLADVDEDAPTFNPDDDLTPLPLPPPPDMPDRICVEYYETERKWRAYVDATGAPEAVASTRDGAMAELFRLLVTWWSCATIEEPERETREALLVERYTLGARIEEINAELEIA